MQTETVTRISAQFDASSQTAPLVDTHAHIYHGRMPMPSSAWHQPTGDATLEGYLQTLDDAGVHFAVLAAASIYGDYNDYMLEAVRRHKRLRATAIVAPGTDPYILQRMKDDGIVGIRLQFRSLAEPPDLSDFEYQKLLKRAADLDWHVHLHDEGDRLPLYIPHIEAAGPRLVIDHFGRPDKQGRLESEGFRAVLKSVERGQTWVKLSGSFRLDEAGGAAQYATSLLQHAGPERLMWGSDWPFAAYEDTMTYAKALQNYRDFIPDASIRRAIDLTALRFYFA